MGLIRTFKADTPVNCSSSQVEISSISDLEDLGYLP